MHLAKTKCQNHAQRLQRMDKIITLFRILNRIVFNGIGEC